LSTVLIYCLRFKRVARTFLHTSKNLTLPVPCQPPSTFVLTLTGGGRFDVPMSVYPLSICVPRLVLFCSWCLMLVMHPTANPRREGWVRVPFDSPVLSLVTLVSHLVFTDTCMYWYSPVGLVCAYVFVALLRCVFAAGLGSPFCGWIIWNLSRPSAQCTITNQMGV